ncbi:VOC family protein [Pontivivens insulae]|uniref:VOC domain-containing protein n=1 Tax=Pontivivens insulae TaxID=1639689 RepID=A0A2R8ADL7_9RHOB|nr:VOC family protein [Pontivivens insulae]RED14224.1 catechol 2,3-dioxygenase-like lactoylglutathione lyase family enzyme [Pontivivens insulae]SPF30299.1 hypothetical protein POI8812_02635 [Pontivivens insulae]
MIDHITIGTANFGVSAAFYAKALEPLGIRRLFDVPMEHTGGVPVCGFGRERPQFWLSGDAPTSGPLHVAFSAADRAAVDAFHAAALAAGGRDNGAPGQRPHYHAHYYGAFVFDPDGHNIEAVCHDAVD